MILNNYGILVEGCWKAIPSQNKQVVPDAFDVMPNHAHGIISIVGARFIAPGQYPNSIMTGYQINQGSMNQGAMNQGTMNQGAMNRAPTGYFAE